MKVEDRQEFKRSKDGKVYLCNNPQPFEPPEHDNKIGIADIVVACFAVLLIAACLFMIVVGIINENVGMIITHLILLAANVLNLYSL